MLRLISINLEDVMAVNIERFTIRRRKKLVN